MDVRKKTKIGDKVSNINSSHERNVGKRTRPIKKKEIPIQKLKNVKITSTNKKKQNVYINIEGVI